MVFNNIFFTFIFLPLSLLLFYIAPKKLKTFVLTAISILFFSWGTPKYIIFIMFSILFNYFGGLEIERQKYLEHKIGARLAMLFTVITDIAFLCFFKYLGFFFRNLNWILRMDLPTSTLAAPLGISFFTFTILSYVFDVYRSKAPAERNLLNFTFYITFFPKMIQGPIVEWNKFQPQLDASIERKFDISLIGEGAAMFIIGLGKKVIIADNLALAYAGVAGLDKLSVASAWLGAIFYTLDIYFDFSSYSDMAIGIAKMFGFELVQNFNYPYLSLSVAEFWRRWHMSLGAWFRNYVYIPLGGNRVSTPKYIRNILVVWGLTGFWHGADWNFIAWGLLYGGLLLLERFAIGNILNKLVNGVRIAYVMLFTIIGFVFFYSPSLTAALKWLGNMFFIGANGIIDSSAIYYFSSNLFLVAIAIIGATTAIKKLGEKVRSYGSIGILAVNVTYAIIFILSTAYMIGSTYSSFLYQQF